MATAEEQESYEKLMRPTGNDPPSLFTQLRCPMINQEYIREKLQLPQQFLGACTLKEGTFVTIVFLQTVAATFAGYMCAYLTVWEKYGNDTWRTKFKEDYDPYMQNAEKEHIEYWWPQWYNFAMALAITHVVYFITGIGVCIGLCYNHAHPFIYLPWLCLTGFLVGTCYSSGFLMFINLFKLAARRPLSVTWDVVPCMCVWLYAVAWSYGFFIVIAHYKRRRIVQFWRKNKRKEFFGGEKLH